MPGGTLPSVDVVIDAVGTGSTLEAALSSARRGGSVVLVGMDRPTVDLPLYDVVAAERAVFGAYSYTARAFEAAAGAVAGGHFPAGAVPRARVSLTEAPEAFARLVAGREPALRVVVFPNGG